ncbi:MAG: spore coat associated protein CotJA [Clostridia bacterium]|nr:spore coat associated protein CotJA [Clostridia bacterium]
MLRRILDNSAQTPPSPSAPPSPRKQDTWGLKNYPLASMYAPLQDFVNLYDPLTALQKGTLFSELDLPFMGKTVTKGGSCRG